jgi:Cytochrome P450
MLQILLIMIMVIFIWYLFSEPNHVSDRQPQPSGSNPYRHADNPYLKIGSGDIHKTIQECKDVLMSTWREKEPAKWVETMTLLETRAGPNLRLAENFGIQNSFTTNDGEYHRKFRGMVAKELKTKDQEWQYIWTSSKEIAHNHMAKQEQKSNIQLVPFVQSIVFKVVMLKFFPRVSTIDKDAAVANITRLINLIWIDSKRPRRPDSTSGILSTAKEILKRHLFVANSTRNLAALKKNLACLFPSHDWKDARENPLNIILPAYETVWRVVFHCIIEVLFRNENRNSVWKASIMKLGESLDSKEKFKLGDHTEGRVSVLDIVNETLRLYPPTKRIYRWEQQENQHGGLDEYPELVAADIEAVHRDGQTWGPDALQFEPGRWARYSRDERKRMMDNLLPFGYGILSCPAKKEFAPKLIALMVVVLLRELEGRFACVAESEEDRIDGPGPLKADRSSYGTLRLRRLGAGVF